MILLRFYILHLFHNQELHLGCKHGAYHSSMLDRNELDLSYNFNRFLTTVRNHC